MIIATWNINGVKARIKTVEAWLKDAEPDVACFQEIKSVDENFPREPLEDLGYHVETHGQKGFNGVAILAKRPLEDILRRLPGDDGDEQARYMEATVSGDNGAVRIACLYLPNGNPCPGPKFDYKLTWMNRLQTRVEDLLAEEMPLVVAGDYNVIPMPEDAKRPDAWTQDALFQPQSRAAFRRLETMGLTDAVRTCHPDPGVYTFWDYQAGAWNKDNGIRIDHLMLSCQAVDRLRGSGVDRETRGWEKPSDHVPVWIDLDL